MPGYNNLSRSAPSDYDGAYVIQQPEQHYQPQYEQQYQQRREERRDSSRPVSKKRQPPPPKPRVDDEDDILSQELGSCKLVVAEEEPGSRGDIDQPTLIEDVHEFNPERRFVFVSGDEPSATENKEPVAEPKKEKEAEVRSDKKPADKVDPVTKTPPSVNRDRGNDKPRSDRSSPRPKDESRPRRDSSPKRPREKEPSSRRYPDSSPRNSDDERLNPRPNTERRRSRQDLPVIDTTLLDDRRQPEHHRSRSAVSATRPDYFSPKQTRYGEQMLSPDVIKHGTNGREQVSYSYLSSSGNYRGGPRDDGPESRSKSSRSVSNNRRSETLDEHDSRRRYSKDRDRDRDQRESASSSRRYEARGSSSRGPSGQSTSYNSRDPSRGNDEYSKSPRSNDYQFQKPVITQGEPRSDRLRVERDDVRRDRSPSRRQTLPIVEHPSASADVKAPTPPLKSAATFAAGAGAAAVAGAMASASSSSPAASKVAPPYPEGESMKEVGGQTKREPNSAPYPELDLVTVDMPDLPPEVASYIIEVSDKDSDEDRNLQRNSWQPVKFDPEKDALPVERPGAYRRYSESQDSQAMNKLPECKRIKPVAGKIDWLTLPRSHFNICPDCYGSVFANSEYRTLFQPFFYPNTTLVSCDFGSSPWYRIAWLLIQKNKDADLGLFLHLAEAMHPDNTSPCPEDKRCTRNWLTIRDPNTGRSVPEFTVCRRCASMVETLLPNMERIFDDRSSASKSKCSMHFSSASKDFVLYFDAFETTAERAMAKRSEPNVSDLARKLRKVSTHNPCREDKPVTDGYWYYAKFLPDLTVCSDCYHSAVIPRIDEKSTIARNFYSKSQRISQATCQLYSARMRDIFKTACRQEDPDYLREKVLRRRRAEDVINGKLRQLEQYGRNDSRTELEIDRLIREWREWE